MPENGLVTVLWTLCLQRTRDHGLKTVSNTLDRHWHMHKKKRQPLAVLTKERKTRLELATPTLARLCSTNWAISAFTFSLLCYYFPCQGWKPYSLRQGCALATELFPHLFWKCLILVNCEGDETRTHTTQRSLPPQSSASTNSATPP